MHWPYLVNYPVDNSLEIMVFFDAMRVAVATRGRSINLMTGKELNKFVAYCRRIQPQSQEDIKRFFEGVIAFPYDNELLLQAYLFLNIQNLFPFCSELLLFEKSPIADYTDLGKCDFVYLTSMDDLFLIETKFIDTEATGATERKRRNKHRNKVFEQVFTLKNKFSQYWNIRIEQLDCGVFTTNPEINWRGDEVNVVTKSVSIHYLEQWRRSYQSRVGRWGDGEVG